MWLQTILQAQNDEESGDFEGMRKNRQFAVGLNLAAILGFFLVWMVIVVVVLPVRASQQWCISSVIMQDMYMYITIVHPLINVFN